IDIVAGSLHDVLHIEGMSSYWFLDYASYVILDCAIPSIEDGLKPVQRRILHTMNVLDDGRYNKAANIIGQTMCYHPHGDAAIAEALVKMAQKELLIDTQGNWGNIYTGDGAAAPRYIEARLNKFAKDVLFNSVTTKWQLSYDGRNQEPYELPVKFPLLLALGAEGIAVGLSTKILPHNFVELIEQSIAHLKGKRVTLCPDFQTGGIADFSNYKDGKRGGKIRIRAGISVIDSKTLKISEIPFGTTTTSVIESILSANEKGNIKIKQVEDNTAKDVEIIIKLPTQISPQQMIEALYAFTECEVSISPNCCVIKDEKPLFCGVSEVLRHSTDQTVSLLKKELEHKQAEINKKLHFATLEKIFIEKKIYLKIEKCETWESVISTIRKALLPHKSEFIQELTEKDIESLTEIRIKRISKFDTDKADDSMKKLKEELKEVRHNLNNLTDYAIEYFKDILEKYGAGKERKTKMETFEAVKAATVAVASEKLYVDRKEGFIGTSLRKDEFVCECSSLDEVIAIRADGTFIVTKVADKVFVGKPVIHVDIFQRGDERRIYHMIYKDGRGGAYYAKRFNITSISRDKEYDLTRGNKNTRIIYLSVQPDGEKEVVRVNLVPNPKLRHGSFKLDFSELEIKNRNVIGSLITEYPIKSVESIETGDSTLGALKVWIDRTTGHLNTEEKGDFLGEFSGSDRIFALYKNGICEVNDFNLASRYGTDLLEIHKYEPDMVVSMIYYEGERMDTYAKRFKIDGELLDKKQESVSSHEKTEILLTTLKKDPVVELEFRKSRKKAHASEKINLAENIEIKGVKALGNKLSKSPIKKIFLLED
ncbi:MAG: DNA gyrase/topoisomerase IV subunit A, partial [Oligoflexales bacterium]|nr:DNA gyrase/topoisomerase IV subunit A [Oligoflexales bacterium]